jgi:hypothetical protein
VDAEIAQIVLGVIVAGAVAAWLIGLRFLLSSARKGESSEDASHGLVDDGKASPTRRLAGGAEVDGEPGSLSARAALLLANGTGVPFVPVKIVEKTDNHIRFEVIGSGGGSPSAVGWFREGLLSFTPLGQKRTRVEWAVELADRDWLLWLGGLFQVVGFIALVAGSWAIYTFVVLSPDPSLRWQTFQMLQVSHFLWPPFLFGALYRQGRQVIAARFEALAHNLPYVGD